ncbi:Poly(rC)-binding protein 2 [Coemansia aciculifera]|nr:Poly(rC)-binding protein 2 [Coemansia aciculifera]
MLIGKEGCHINKLKASTTAAWSITGSNANNEDRVVVIGGSAEGVINAVHALTEHMDQQQRIVPTTTSGASRSTSALTLRILFPSSCIGLLIGPAGARVSKLRIDSKVDRLHIYRDNIGSTDERVIEISGEKRALCSAVKLLLSEAGPALAKQQSVSTLYKPVHNGLRRLQSQERHSTTAEVRVDSYRPGSAKSQSRTRSYSLVGLSETGPSRNGSDRHRQKRRISENSDSDSDLECKSSKRRMSEAAEPDRAYGSQARHGRSHRNSPPQMKRRSTASTHSPRSASSSGRQSPDEASKEEKLVIPDSVAGRLIGRKGSYLLALETQSGAHITLSPRVKNMTDRIVTVVGRTAEVSTACKLIRNSVQSFEDLEA